MGNRICPSHSSTAQHLEFHPENLPCRRHPWSWLSLPNEPSPDHRLSKLREIWDLHLLIGQPFPAGNRNVSTDPFCRQNRSTKHRLADCEIQQALLEGYRDSLDNP